MGSTTETEARALYWVFRTAHEQHIGSLDPWEELHETEKETWRQAAARFVAWLAFTREN